MRRIEYSKVPMTWLGIFCVYSKIFNYFGIIKRLRFTSEHWVNQKVFNHLLYGLKKQ